MGSSSAPFTNGGANDSVSDSNMTSLFGTSFRLQEQLSQFGPAIDCKQF